MDRFNQLGKRYDTQVSNWIRGARIIYGPKGHRDSTQALIASQKQKVETATEYREKIQHLDWDDFDALLQKLKPLPRMIFKLSKLHYYVDERGHWHWVWRRKWEVMGMTEHHYKQQLRWAKEMIQQWGELE